MQSDQKSDEDRLHIPPTCCCIPTSADLAPSYQFQKSQHGVGVRVTSLRTICRTAAKSSVWVADLWQLYHYCNVNNVLLQERGLKEFYENIFLMFVLNATSVIKIRGMNMLALFGFGWRFSMRRIVIEHRWRMSCNLVFFKLHNNATTNCYKLWNVKYLNVHERRR